MARVDICLFPSNRACIRRWSLCIPLLCLLATDVSCSRLLKNHFRCWKSKMKVSRSDALTGQAVQRAPQIQTKNFVKRGGIKYHRNFLEQKQFEDVLAECRQLRPKIKKEQGSIATGRMGARLDEKSCSYKFFKQDEIVQKLGQILGINDLVPTELPIELRVYPAGSGMEWHRDDVLFEPAQVEIVFTVENQCGYTRTEWLSLNGDLDFVHTEPNSVIAVQAGESGPMHRVTQVKRGERTILKLTYAHRGYSRNSNFHEDGFESIGVRNQKKQNKLAGKGSTKAQRSNKNQRRR